MTAKSKKIERAELFAAQGGRCAYCDEPMTKVQGTRLCTVDHVIPKCIGGNDGLKVAACHQCNRLKGCMTLEQIRQLADRIEYFLSRDAHAREGAPA